MYKIIGGDGREYGPITETDLRKWIAEGRLSAQSLARSESDAEFRPLSTFPEFADLFGTAAFAPGTTASTAPAIDWSNRDYVLDLGGCFSRGWTLFTNNLGIFVGCTALFFVCIFAGSAIVGSVFGVILAMLSQATSHSPTFMIIQNLVVRVITSLFIGPLMGGLFYVFILRMREQPAGVGALFVGFQRSYLQLFLGHLLFTLTTAACFIPYTYIAMARLQPMLDRLAHSPAPDQMLGLLQQMFSALAGTWPVYCLSLIPAAYLLTSLQFTLPLIIDRRIDFWTAIKTSWKMVHKHWFTVFGLVVLVVIINAVGVLLCCIGVLFTMPITTAACMFAYETIFCEPPAPRLTS